MPQVNRPKGKSEKIRLDQLTVWPELQKRAEGLDQDHAAGIGRVVKDGKALKSLERVKVRRVTDLATLPPELLATHPDRTVWNLITDGIHTCEGFRLANVKEVPCDVLAGTYADAFYDACGANAGHLAKKRTKADREKAVSDLVQFNRTKGVRWTQTKIAEVCNVDKHTVRDIIHRLGLDAPEDKDVPVVGRGGKAPSHIPQARKTKERSASDPEVPVTSSGGWRELPLTECLEAPDYAWKNFEARKIETAGQLYDAIRKGQLLGFMGADAKDCMKQLEALKAKQEVKEKPTAQGKASYEWAKMESHYGVVVRMVDELPRLHPDVAGTPDFQGMHRNLEAFKDIFDKVKARLTKSQK